MKWSAFRTRVPGKWVLCGEHAVLRGITAVALQHPVFGLELSFEPGSSGKLEIFPQTVDGLMRGMLESMADQVNEESRSFPWPEGILRIESTIPISAGLGSSAALCVAFVRWIAEPLGLPPLEWFELAKAFENRFHGKSSGMDIAAVSASGPISFSGEAGPRPLRIRKLPYFTFHDTSLRSRTSDCIARVEELREKDPGRAMVIDERMALASRTAIEGLSRYDRGDESTGVNLVADAMKQARECFHAWRLVPEQAKALEERLLQQGARAVKLTGAGGGGFVVALWDNMEDDRSAREP